MTPIPAGWNDYVRVGKRIAKTRFIAFKVPLREAPNRNCNITEENLWHPKLVVTQIPNIGLVIDITNTAKYYSPQDFLELGVDHKKIYVQGHQVPSKENYKEFHQAVQNFLTDNANNDKLIGVHCTHGLNRTGFLVCRYMIQEMKMTANEAISLFEAARGHKIERENYTNKLKTIEAGCESDTKSDSSSRRVTERQWSHSSGKRKRISNVRPTLESVYPRGDSCRDRPNSHTSSSSRTNLRIGNPYRKPPSQSTPSESQNWRDTNHQYASSNSSRFAVATRHRSQNRRFGPSEATRSTYRSEEQRHSSRYSWNRDEQQQSRKRPFF